MQWMRTGLLIGFLFFFLLSLYGQEVCDNGIDDDGDGQIDLYDPECVCNGIHIPVLGSSKIPNPSFEDKLWCPTSWAEMTAVVAWESGTMATPDYLNTCGFVWPAIPDANLVPFPDGEGILGMVFKESHMEYVAACLIEPFQAGDDYELTFQIASVPMGFAGEPCNNGVITYPTVEFSLFGSPSCGNMDVQTVGCPTAQDPFWVLLGSVTYNPQTVWSEVTISFTPAQDIKAIMLGPPCVMPNGYQFPGCTPYMMIDGLTLDEVQHYLTLDIEDDGIPCQPGYQLSASFPLTGGTWQWYYQGVALPGQQSSQLLVVDNDQQSGMYQVTYSLNGECVQDSFYVEIVLPEPSEEEAWVCPGGSVKCAGKYFYQGGSFPVILKTDQGCDSLVTCLIYEYDLPPVTKDSLETCQGEVIEYCQDVFSESGEYTVVCENWQGCDSVIILDLTYLEPSSQIAPPEPLSCDTMAWVELNGEGSPLLHPTTGSTTFSWFGPPGGLKGVTNEPVAWASLPGEYCLVVHFMGNQIICSDTSCVTVISDLTPPNQPELTGPDRICQADTLQIKVNSSSSADLQWIVDSNASIVGHSDSILQVISHAPGVMTVGVWAINGCGSSDTSWTTVLVIASSDSVRVIQTCDPGLVGQDSLLLQNQYGCDSLVITQTVLLPSDVQTIQLNTCVPQAAGLDTLYLTNQSGCDSTVFITTTYTGTYQATSTVLICGQGVDYLDTLVVTSGPCDSLFITQYQYTPLDTTWLTGSTCQASQAGTFVQVLPDQFGCDSTIITVMTLSPSDTTLVEGVTCNKTDEFYDEQTLTNQWGCDSVVWTAIIYIGVDTQYLQQTTCDPALAGIQTLVIPGLFCDTVRVIETIWLPFTISTDTLIVCAVSGPTTDTLFLVNQTRCDSLVIRIYQYTDLQATWLLTDETCAGYANGEIEVTDVQGGVLPYAYRLNGGAWQADGSFPGLPPGSYDLEVRDAGDCQLLISGQMIGAGEVLVIDAGPDRTAKVGDVIDLSVQSSSALAQVQWTATDPLNCPGCIQAVLGPLSKSQTVLVSGVSVNGCPGQDDLYVDVLDRPLVFIPNSFSPDGDGINDIFSVYSSVDDVRIEKMRIFDRWGNALYEHEALSVNDPASGWDGTFRQEPVDPGVYVYVIELRFGDGRQQIYKGDLTILK